jgi:adenylate kinase family enzyme
VVIGSSCAGKTTLARRISNVLAVPHVELDALHWGPNWTERPDEVLRDAVRERASGEGWVIDGNYSKVQDIVWPRATDAVWLNYSFPVVFGRALRRTVRRMVTREELFGGNRESFRNSFLSRDSILWWVITTFGRRRRQYERTFEGRSFPELRLTELHHQRDADALLERLKESRRSGT